MKQISFAFLLCLMSIMNALADTNYTNSRQMSSDAGVIINEETFPDEYFRKWVTDNCDINQDGYLSNEEMAAVNTIDVSGQNICDLTGIEYFTALSWLYCNNNQLTSLDVSGITHLLDIYCNNNQLTSLDLSKNTELFTLDCSNNQLTSLDVTENTDLVYLFCYDNQLSSLDLSKNTALKHLECNNNQLSSLDVSNSTALFWLFCYDNQLASLDVSKNTQLEYLHCQTNQLTSLDVSKNTALTTLYCLNNQITTLDLSKNTQLEELRCWDNQLTSLDVSGNTSLKEIRCYNNQIKDEAMDVLINGLPTVENGDFTVIDTSSSASEGNVCTKAQVDIAKGKGWNVFAHTDSHDVKYEGSDPSNDNGVVAATCKEVIDGQDGTIYRVTGVVKEIKNTTYGNWYLEDETGTIYIYGTVDENGQYPRYSSWESFGINVGNTITVQGPKLTYNNYVELVDVRVLKPLTLLSESRINIDYHEKDVAVKLYCESDSYEVEIPESTPWVTVKERTTGTYPVVTLHIEENKGMSRWTSIKISNTVDGTRYEKGLSISQGPYYFTEKTEEGIELSYRLQSENDKTCVVSGIGEDPYKYYPALDTLAVGHVTIPAEVNGYKVVGIDYNAFENCRNITGVTMPETMTTIYSNAFKGCTSLENIQFPASLSSLGMQIFEDTKWFDNQPDGVLYINDLLYTYKGEMPEDSHIDVREDCRVICSGAFQGQTNLTGITLPEGLETIDGFAFSWSGIKEIVIPKSCKWMQTRCFFRCSSLEEVTIMGNTYMYAASFSLCPNLKKVTCFSVEPPNTYKACFYYSYEDKNDNSIYERVTLYVPHGSKDAYQSVAPWSEFQNIVEMDLQPIDNGENINIGSEIDSDTNLDGNVVGNILYNISSGDGEYDPTEGCIVVYKPTSDEAMNSLLDKDVFSDEFKEQFTGVVFKVAEGSGSVSVDAETTGNMQMKMKIGTADPVKLELDGRQKKTIPYEVSEETYVYLYGSAKDAEAKAMNLAGELREDSNSLKIFGIQITKESTGINVGFSEDQSQDIYNMSGQKVRSKAMDVKGLPTGVYIRGGKKLVVR